MNFTESCFSDHFHCNITKKCIPLRHRCDNDEDCGGMDKSDEENCGEYNKHSIFNKVK